MRTVLALSLILAATPAIGADCFFTNYSGQRIVFDDAEHLTIHGTKGEIERCGLAVYPDNPRLKTAVCESGWQEDYVLGSSIEGAPEPDILSFSGVFWYRKCYEPA